MRKAQNSLHCAREVFFLHSSIHKGRPYRSKCSILQQYHCFVFALYRFIPRHEDELELDVDDPLYVEEEEDDYWYRGYNMRTGEKGIFPAFYAHEVIGQSKELLSEW